MLLGGCLVSDIQTTGNATALHPLSKTFHRRYELGNSLLLGDLLLVCNLLLTVPTTLLNRYGQFFPIIMAAANLYQCVTPGSICGTAG